MTTGYVAVTEGSGKNLATNTITEDAITKGVQRVVLNDSAGVELTANIGALTETAPATDTASSGLNGRLQRIAQRITSLITALGSPFQAGGSIANTSFASTVANGANAVEGTTTDAAVITDATGTIQQYLRGLVKILLTPANPDNFVSGAITTAMTGTTSTSLLAAPAAGLRNYITTIIVSNAHASVGTDVIIQDGSGGTTLLTIPAAAVYGGATITLPTPLRQPTTATAIYCANVTTGASTKVSAVGYKGA